MFLMFGLLRPNVFPLDDLGLQRAICLNYFQGRSVSLRTMRKIASAWDPWRSVATWYLWRSLDPIPVEYEHRTGDERGAPRDSGTMARFFRDFLP